MKNQVFCYLKGKTNLRSSEADARSLPHDPNHVVNGALVLVEDDVVERHIPSRLVKNGVTGGRGLVVGSPGKGLLLSMLVVVERRTTTIDDHQSLGKTAMGGVEEESRAKRIGI